MLGLSPYSYGPSIRVSDFVQYSMDALRFWQNSICAVGSPILLPTDLMLIGFVKTTVPCQCFLFVVGHSSRWNMIYLALVLSGGSSLKLVKQKFLLLSISLLFGARVHTVCLMETWTFLRV